jgi:hypothetical protein
LGPARHSQLVLGIPCGSCPRSRQDQLYEAGYHRTFCVHHGSHEGGKARIEKRQSDLLSERYDLSNRSVRDVLMERDRPLQEGVRVKLPEGMTWEKLASLPPDEIRDKNLFPKGFYPLPHPNHPEGGMLFPHYEIDEIKKLDARDISRFDLSFDVPQSAILVQQADKVVRYNQLPPDAG